MATPIKRRELFSSFAGIGASPAGAQVCSGADLIPNVKLRTHEGNEVRFSSPKIVFDGDTHLGGEGGEPVHRRGDKDSDGDAAVEHASKVWAV